MEVSDLDNMVCGVETCELPVVDIDHASQKGKALRGRGDKLTTTQRFCQQRVHQQLAPSFNGQWMMDDDHRAATDSIIIIFTALIFMHFQKPFISPIMHLLLKKKELSQFYHHPHFLPLSNQNLLFHANLPHCRCLIDVGYSINLQLNFIKLNS